MMRFFDSRAGKDQINLQPGEMHVTSEDIILYTVLGSCISVCLYDDAIGLAGMNHFMLPKRGTGSIFSAEEEEGRFGDEAIERLLRKMYRKGADRARLVAKVFGGANSFGRASEECVANSNKNTAFEVLAGESIPIVAMDTGGMRGRRIYFDAESGLVRVETLGTSGFDSCDTAPKSRNLAVSLPSVDCIDARGRKSTP